MKKVAFCSVADKNGNIIEIINKISQIGYDGIEIWEPHIHRFINEGGILNKLSQILQEKKLEVPVISSYFSFMDGEEAYNKSIEHAVKLFKYCSELNCKYIRVLMDWIASKDATNEQWNLGIKALQELSDIFNSDGAGLVLETHMNQLFDTTDSNLKVIELVNRDNVKINLDIYNMFLIGEDPAKSLERLIPYTEHIHLKNGRIVNGEIKCGYFLSDGEMDYRPFFKKLKELNYNGYIAVEWFGENIWGAAKHELEYIRGI